MAMEAGATGILGGRAFWKEYFLQDGEEARTRFAAETGYKRVADLDAIVRERGTPWFARYGLAKEEMTTIRAAEGWHFRYAPHRRGRPAARRRHRRPAGEVY
jgi:tagatose 1,6-diphosphate aldolase